MTADTSLRPALSVENLSLDYRIGTQWKTAIKDVNFVVPKGQSFGLVGESGCGKTTIAMSVVRYLPRNGRISGGKIELAGRDINALSQRQLRELRVREVSMVYQNPASSLNPSIRVGRQVADVFELMHVPDDEIDDRVIDILERVRIADPGRVVRRYPHQLSGGMLQRVVIAMAIASEPELLILDEPTTGLDATVEAEVLDLVGKLREEMGTSVLFISHSLAVIRQMCDRVGVLYAGRLVAEGPAEDVFTNPKHPYTVGLLRCLPTGATTRSQAKLDTIPGFLPPLGADIQGCVYADRCGIAEEMCHTVPPPRQILENGRQSLCHFPERSQELPRTEAVQPADRKVGGTVLLDIKNASKTFQQEGHPVFALSDVDLSIREGETVALVGESGSGKSTLARLILGIHAPDDGSVVELKGQALGDEVHGRGVDQVRAIQMVFQDPDSALNRRHSVKRILNRAVERLLDVGRRESSARTRHLVSEVRMGEQHLSSKPRHLSGGLKQRVAVARAFAGAPMLVVCDEPTSALDVSVQAAIINLLADLQAEEGVAYLFISHDLSVVRYIADRVAVMYLGRLMEVGTSERVFSGPHHPYTEALLSAAPGVEGETRVRIRLTGEIPSPSNPPSGCVFHTRCHRFIEGTCDVIEPPLVEAEPGYRYRCHIPIDELRRLQQVGREPQSG